MICSIQIRSLYGAVCALCVLALIVTAIPPAFAGDSEIIIGNYVVEIGSSERLLDAFDKYGPDSPEYMEIQKEESCDNPHYRIRARNAPAVLIQNVAGSQGPLTSFTMTIQEAAYIFGFGGDSAYDGFDEYIKHSAYTDPDVAVIGSSRSDDGQSLTVNFSGLTEGKSVIFRTDIDINDIDPQPGYESMFPYPDFRMVLFGGEDGMEGEIATTSAIFDIDGVPISTEETPLIDVFEDITYYGEHTRPYHAMDMVDTGGGGGGIGIPEPSALILMFTSLASLAALRRADR